VFGGCTGAYVKTGIQGGVTPISLSKFPKMEFVVVFGAFKVDPNWINCV